MGKIFHTISGEKITKQKLSDFIATISTRILHASTWCPRAQKQVFWRLVLCTKKCPDFFSHNLPQKDGKSWYEPPKIGNFFPIKNQCKVTGKQGEKGSICAHVVFRVPLWTPKTWFQVLKMERNWNKYSKINISAK